MELNDRIRLAEAMGWLKPRHGQSGWSRAVPVSERDNGWETREHSPNPFTDANDDYAVLEWMRAIEAEGLDRDMLHMRFATELCGLKTMYDYQIGDYARAALKVIE